MRAALVRELGGIGSVELSEWPDPMPAAGQAVVRVRGAGIGPWDVSRISGTFRPLDRLPCPTSQVSKSPASSNR